jgi:hypothetical protein
MILHPRAQLTCAARASAFTACILRIARGRAAPRAAMRRSWPRVARSAALRWAGGVSLRHAVPRAQPGVQIATVPSGTLDGLSRLLKLHGRHRQWRACRRCGAHLHGSVMFALSPMGHAVTAQRSSSRGRRGHAHSATTATRRLRPTRWPSSEHHQLRGVVQLWDASREGLCLGASASGQRLQMRRAPWLS